MASIMGGPSTFFGPILGMFIMTFFHAWILGFTHFWPVIMGALILVVIFFLPGGILGFAQERMMNRRKKGPPSKE
jgi:ABC-type branched-subunit amino acid transport system permease subunit